MNIRDSQIMQTALTKLFPFALMFSIYLFSFGGVYPGGGFQAGVVIGTLVVIIELVLERKLYSDAAFERIELSGVALLALLLITGFILSGFPFGGFYRLQGTSDPLANLMIWLLSCAIFLEVAGSMVLIFRGFLFWESEEDLYILNPRVVFEAPKQGKNQKKQRDLKVITVLTAAMLISAAAAAFLLLPPIEPVFNEEVESVRQLTKDYGIRNMVSTVYLGPRVMDTFLEVMVVVLTVFGVKAVRSGL